jgi:hypothetical protein
LYQKKTLPDIERTHTISEDKKSNFATASFSHNFGCRKNPRRQSDETSKRTQTRATTKKKRLTIFGSHLPFKNGQKLQKHTHTNFFYFSLP